jgi:hypothetical protein
MMNLQIPNTKRRRDLAKKGLFADLGCGNLFIKPFLDFFFGELSVSIGIKLPECGLYGWGTSEGKKVFAACSSAWIVGNRWH